MDKRAAWLDIVGLNIHLMKVLKNGSRAVFQIGMVAGYAPLLKGYLSVIYFYLIN